MQPSRDQVLALAAGAAAGVLGPLAYIRESATLGMAFTGCVGIALTASMMRSWLGGSLGEVALAGGAQSINIFLAAPQARRAFLGSHGLDMLLAVHGDESHVNFLGQSTTAEKAGLGGGKRCIITNIRGTVTAGAEQRLVQTVQAVGLRGVPQSEPIVLSRLDGQTQFPFVEVLVFHSVENASPMPLCDAIKHVCEPKGIDVEELSWVSDQQQKVEGHIQFVFTNKKHESIFWERVRPQVRKLEDHGWSLRRSAFSESPTWPRSSGGDAGAKS